MMANNSSSKWLLLKHDCLEVRHSFCRDALVYVNQSKSPIIGPRRMTLRLFSTTCQQFLEWSFNIMRTCERHLGSEALLSGCSTAVIH